MTNNRLYGKTIVALGDSLIYGGRHCPHNTWLEMMAERNEMTLFNYGQNGNTVAVQHVEAQPLPPMCVRYADMAEGADYVVVLGGANDKRLSVPIENGDPKDPESFCGALRVLLEGLVAKYPKARILFMTNYNRRPSKNKLGFSDIDYVEAMMRVCGEYAIPCFDNYHCSGISFQNPAHAAWMDEGIVHGDALSCHFSAEAYEWLSYKYEALLASL